MGVLSAFGAVGAVFVAIVTAWVTLNVQINTAFNNGVTNQNEISAIQARLGRIEEKLDILSTESTRQASSLVEVETQFCAEDVVRNQMHLDELRSVALLWRKVFAADFPLEASYFPSICRKKD